MKRALILDLDNTIYPVKSIADQLFAELFEILDQEFLVGSGHDINNVKEEMMRRPFQYIADKYEFSTELRYKITGALKNMTYNLPMQPYVDYAYIRTIPLDKFLVTTGFLKLQLSKVKSLGIEEDFKEIIIVDPEAGLKTKKDVFADIMNDHNYTPDEILVIGDDPDSEIKAAALLGIDTFLFDPESQYPDAQVSYRSAYLKDVLGVLN